MARWLAVSIQKFEKAIKSSRNFKRESKLSFIAVGVQVLIVADAVFVEKPSLAL